MPPPLAGLVVLTSESDGFERWFDRNPWALTLAIGLVFVGSLVHASLALRSHLRLRRERRRLWTEGVPVTGSITDAGHPSSKRGLRAILVTYTLPDGQRVVTETAIAMRPDVTVGERIFLVHDASSPHVAHPTRKAFSTDRGESFTYVVGTMTRCGGFFIAAITLALLVSFAFDS